MEYQGVERFCQICAEVLGFDSAQDIKFNTINILSNMTNRNPALYISPDQDWNTDGWPEHGAKEVQEKSTFKR